MIPSNLNSLFKRLKHPPFKIQTVALFMTYLIKVAIPAAINIDEVLRQHKIIPEMVDVAPKYVIDIAYRNNTLLMMGNKIDPADMQWVPRVKWPSRHGNFYTLMMVDPDVPVRKNPALAQRQHWVVGNIPMNNVRRGETLTGYIGPISPRNSGLHRTTFLVYEQKGKLDFSTEPRYSSAQRLGHMRHKFSNRQFAEKYGLKLFAVNFFRVGWPLFNYASQKRPRYNPFLSVLSSTSQSPLNVTFSHQPEKADALGGTEADFIETTVGP